MVYKSPPMAVWKTSRPLNSGVAVGLGLATLGFVVAVDVGSGVRVGGGEVTVGSVVAVAWGAGVGDAVGGGVAVEGRDADDEGSTRTATCVGVYVGKGMAVIVGSVAAVGPGPEAQPASATTIRIREKQANLCIIALSC
jgi:hypothetical protein